MKEKVIPLIDKDDKVQNYHKTSQLISDLPANILECTGRVAVKYTMIENTLKDIVYTLLGCDRRTGSLLVSGANPLERLDKIKLCCDTLKIDIDWYKEYRAQFAACVTVRNAMIHGVWSFDDEKYLITIEKGNVGNNEKGEKIKVAIAPTLVEINDRKIKEVDKSFEEILNGALILRDFIMNKVGRTMNDLRIPERRVTTPPK